MTRDEIKKWMLESSGFPVTQANVEYLERFQAIAFQAGAASLDAEIAKLKHQRDYWKEQRDSSAAYERDLRDQLRAEINVLLEAMGRLEKYVSYNGDTWVQKEARNALSTTPEQSLAEYRNKVIEECAAVLNVAITRLSSCGASIKNDVAISTLKEQSCRLRAMKEKP